MRRLLCCNFNPRPPRGGRQVDALCLTRRYVISIHALREEGDGTCRPVGLHRHNFNPRPPRGGRPAAGRSSPALLHFNPRPPRGGRLLAVVKLAGFLVISIHALREEGDATAKRRRYQDSIFQSTPSARRATRYFFADSFKRFLFQSTPSARRATVGNIYDDPDLLFQSTPSARRATAYRLHSGRLQWYFNPRPPRGGRPVAHDAEILIKEISIHALREEGDPESNTEVTPK